MTGLSIETRIKRLIVEVLDLEIDPDLIDDDEALFGGGMGMDSQATLEIVVGIEDEFGIEVSDEDLRVDMFDSVRVLAQYVKDKLESNISPRKDQDGELLHSYSPQKMGGSHDPLALGKETGEHDSISLERFL